MIHMFQGVGLDCSSPSLYIPMPKCMLKDLWITPIKWLHRNRGPKIHSPSSKQE